MKKNKKNPELGFIITFYYNIINREISSKILQFNSINNLNIRNIRDENLFVFYLFS